MNITNDTTIHQILDDEEFAAFKNELIANANDDYFSRNPDCTLQDIHTNQPAWDTEDMIYGLEGLRGASLIQSASVSHPSLIYLKAHKKTQKPFILLCAGGAFGSVCTMVESLPTARKFNELGYDCFCLNYRTATPASFVSGLLPKPMDDVAWALQSIKEHSTDFDIDADHYVLAGFSAGGYVAAAFGCAHIGAAHYGLKQPLALILCYALTSSRTMNKSTASDIINLGMYGLFNRKKKKDYYDIPSHIDSTYPPAFCVSCEDDSTISKEDGIAFRKALNDNNIPSCSFIGKTGGHGFGLGSKTDIKGWVEQADCFLRGNR